MAPTASDAVVDGQKSLREGNGSPQNSQYQRSWSEWTTVEESPLCLRGCEPTSGAGPKEKKTGLGRGTRSRWTSEGGEWGRPTRPGVKDEDRTPRTPCTYGSPEVVRTG